MRVDFETDVGAVRSSNQDSCDCGLFSPNSAWVIVCDGMGGANGGNVASAIAVETIREQLLSGYDENLSKPNLKNLMINAINRANEEVHRVSLERPELHGMGTTVVLLVAAKGTLHVAHVGDSRAYLRHLVKQNEMLGGILLGIIEIFGKSYISTELGDAIVFAILIVILLVKPAGLLGKKIREKV